MNTIYPSLIKRSPWTPFFLSEGLFRFDLLEQPDVQKDPCLPIYLVLICVGLKDPVRRQAFRVLSKSDKILRQLREDMKGILHVWDGNPS